MTVRHGLPGLDQPAGPRASGPAGASGLPLPGRSHRVMQRAAEEMAPIPLSEVMDQAALQTRVDRKFLLAPDELADLKVSLGDGFRALEIDGRRDFEYESVYFDTPDLGLYRAHRQGRRRRYKVRTRTYVDNDVCMFEAKFKGGRGDTVKHRLPYRLDDGGRLTGDAKSFLARHLGREYGMELPQLEPVLRTDYRRATFVDSVNQERLTCDVDPACSNADTSVLGPDMIVVETKTIDGKGASDRALAAMGIRPVSMSKYCLGIALLHPQLPANRWNRLLRTQFGWKRLLVD